MKTSIVDFRLGYGDHFENKNPEDEVNEYLSRAIDARETGKLRGDNMICSLSFRRQSLEEKVEKRVVIVVWAVVVVVDFFFFCGS